MNVVRLSSEPCIWPDHIVISYLYLLGMTEEIVTGTEIDADHEAETERREKEAGHLVRRREVVVRTEVLVLVEGNLLYAEDSLRQESKNTLL